MTAAVLAKSYVTVSQRSLDGRKLAGPQILAAQKPVNGPGAHCSYEHALAVHPSIAFAGGATADEHGTRRTQGDQFMRVHRQIVPGQRAGVLEEVAGHPVILARTGDVLNDLAPIAAVELVAAFS